MKSKFQSSTESIIEGIKVVIAAAIPLAIAFGVSGGDVESLGEAAEAAVIAGSGLVVAARMLWRDIQNRGG